MKTLLVWGGGGAGEGGGELNFPVSQDLVPRPVLKIRPIRDEQNRDARTLLVPYSVTFRCRFKKN